MTRSLYRRAADGPTSELTRPAVVRSRIRRGDSLWRPESVWLVVSPWPLPGERPNRTLHARYVATFPEAVALANGSAVQAARSAT